MNTVRKMSYENSQSKADKSKLYVINSNISKEDKILVNGKLMSKHELNEKLAYFYENGGPVMDI